MGLKIEVEIVLPLTKTEAETLMGISMMNVTLANGAIADLEPSGPGQACAALDPNVDATQFFAICTYASGHEGRHRFVNFGPPVEE